MKFQKVGYSIWIHILKDSGVIETCIDQILAVILYLFLKVCIETEWILIIKDFDSKSCLARISINSTKWSFKYWIHSKLNHVRVRKLAWCSNSEFPNVLKSIKHYWWIRIYEWTLFCCSILKMNCCFNLNIPRILKVNKI